MEKLNRLFATGLVVTVAAVIVWGFRNFPLFFDTIQFSGKHPWWFWQQGFGSLRLPPDVDSGHPPYWGMYIAACWKLLGVQLWVTHLAMFPFLVLLGSGALALGRLAHRQWPLGLLLCFACDPTIAAQATLVSPDVALLGFWCWGVWAIMTWKQQGSKFPMLYVSVLGFSVLGLGMVSTRGMMVGFGLFLWQCWINRFTLKKVIWYLLPYVPGGLLALFFLVWHHQVTGWIGHHPDSPWSPSFQRVGLSGMVRNAALIAWRLLDFGRLFVWIALLGLFVWGFTRHKRVAFNNPWISLLCIMVLVLSPAMLLYQALTAHRYLMPVFGAFYLVFIQESGAWKTRQKQVVMTCLVVMAVLGNWLVYPKGIAQGWDASLAYVNYMHTRQAMIDYLEKEGIAYDAVQAGFPQAGKEFYRTLNADDFSKPAFHPIDTLKHRFVWYSNGMNEFTDEQIQTLETQYDKRRSYNRNGVWQILYERKED